MCKRAESERGQRSCNNFQRNIAKLCHLVCCIVPFTTYYHSVVSRESRFFWEKLNTLCSMLRCFRWLIVFYSSFNVFSPPSLNYPFILTEKCFCFPLYNILEKTHCREPKKRYELCMFLGKANLV